MKTNTLIKIVSVILLAVLLASTMSPMLLANDWRSTTQFDNKSDANLDSSATKIVGAILSVTRIVAVGIALIMLIAVAMKYMMAAPGDRAEIKKHAVIYVVGAVVLFASAGILDIIKDFSDNIGGNS